MKVSIILIGVLLNVSCNTRNESFEVSTAQQLAVYVEARNVNDGLGSGSYGDIHVMDLSSQRTKRVTDDRFYDKSPQFISEGTEILFQSNRYGDRTLLAVQGISGPYDECVYNLMNDSIKPLNIIHQTERPKYLRSSLEDFQPFPSTGCYLYHYVAEGLICITDSLTNRVAPFIDLGQYGEIGQFKISPDKKNIVFQCRPQEGTYDGEYIGIISLADKKHTKVRERASIQSWSTDGKRMVFDAEDTVFVYSVGDQLSTVLFVVPQNLIIDDCHMIGENEVVFLGRTRKYIDEVGSRSLASTTFEVYRYKIKENALVQLTTNGYDKSDLDVYLRK